MPKNHTFLVTLSVPDGVTLDDAEVYIENAVRAGKSAPNCDNPWRMFDPATVDVVAAASTRRAGEPRKTPRT